MNRFVTNTRVDDTGDFEACLEAVGCCFMPFDRSDIARLAADKSLPQDVVKQENDDEAR